MIATWGPRGRQRDRQVARDPGAGVGGGRQFDEAIRIGVCVAGRQARTTRRALWVVTVIVASGWGGAVAHADRAQARGTAGTPRRAADAPVSDAHPVAGAKQAPGGPALGPGSGAVAGAGGGEVEGAGATVQGESDPLVGNGLGSPLCKGALGGGLSAASRRDCETSGFVAAPAPTGDYGIDVHIDTGVIGFTTTSTVQDLFVTPLWTALVWAVHALVVMLEWCYTIDLLDSASPSVGSGLRQMQSSLTGPWLATVLAVASVLAAYNGLVRRRVAETVGQALMTLAMMAGGMWVILDPTGTVGTLGGWANQASLGTLAVTARGTPAAAGQALADSMGSVFAATIEAPWCYLEFGDVGWCRNPARLDSRLRAAGLKIAAGEQLQASSSSAGVQARALERSAEQLRDADSNAEVFLALPPNGPARNSINEQGSLLRTLCQSSDATACRGPTAAQAQFRTSGGTWARVAGLLLIVAGVLGMMLLLGFIALRLLGAALFSLLYLLLAPAAVLAPALGDSGRAVFRRWAARLLGAVVAKLMYSFLLGVVLAVVAILEDLGSLGWWTQWLLMSAFWWGAYAHRHQALGVTEGTVGHERAGRPRSIARRVRETLETPRAAIGVARRTKARLSKPAPSVERRRKRTQAGGERAKQMAQAQVGRSLEHELGEARMRAQAGPETQARLSGMRAQLARVQRERKDATAAGNMRRAAELGAREQRIAGEIAGEENALRQARRTVADSDSAKRRTGETHTREQREERARFLDVQAALPAAARASANGERRDYAALAGLAGYGRDAYERLDPRHRREARARIDRELAMRRELSGAAADMAARVETGSLGWREKRKGGRELEGVLGERLRSEGHRRPDAPRGGSRLEDWKREGAAAVAAHPRGRRTGSPVLDDAREVAARRKRQLGRDRR